MSRPRLLILVVAYHAASTLENVLDRIPAEVTEDYECEILVVDDASADETFEVGRRYKVGHPELPLRVLRNQLNQGYGGNQKVGYAYAEKYGFDLVALLHGDGQYAPEMLPELLAPFAQGTDMVFGSRMLQRGEARAGGMPLYKYVGNRILTTIQNALLRTSLSEFHSGYRVYRVAALARTRYRLNSNDFHFDTEIILQLLSADAQISEVPIPTYYGDEISRVNGLAYAANVLRVTLQYATHRLGLLGQRRFEPIGPTEYSAKLGYASSHQWAVDAVPEGATVLDLGGGEGTVANALAARGCRVTLLEHPSLVEQGEHRQGVSVLAHDLNAEFDLDLTPFDVLLLLDLIEHLQNPEAFIDGLRARFSNETKLIVMTTPNIAFAVNRLGLLLGQFNYGPSGILDRTHTRLFTFRTLRKLLQDAGLRIEEVRGIPAPFPAALGDTALARFLLNVNRLLIRLNRRLFSFQIYMVVTSTPDLDFLIDDALRSEQTT